jgi:hypothetical protein
MRFIGYRRMQESEADIIRLYLECRDEPAAGTVTCGYAVDVLFPSPGAECRLRGVDSVLALKKFYKLVFSLEERAREHGNDWRSVTASPERLLEHLGYTRNARDLTGATEPQLRAGDAATEPE